MLLLTREGLTTVDVYEEKRAEEEEMITPEKHKKQDAKIKRAKGEALLPTCPTTFDSYPPPPFFLNSLPFFFPKEPDFELQDEVGASQG